MIELRSSLQNKAQNGENLGRLRAGCGVLGRKYQAEPSDAANLPCLLLSEPTM
jgi:hypothetical protein